MSTVTKKMSQKNGFPRCGSSLGICVLFAVLIIALFAGPAEAGEGWKFRADVAVLSENVYVGSDEYYVMPLVSLRAAYPVGAYTFFIAFPLEGIGVSYVNMKTGLSGCLAVNFGGQRESEEYSVIGFPVGHSDKTRALLKDSPEVSTPVVVEARLDYPTAFGVLGAALGYHPTSISYDRIGIEDDVRHGLLFSIQYMNAVPVTRRLLLAGILSVEFMDGNYADLWHAVDHETEALAEFDAGVGARDAQIALNASYSLTERVGLSFYCANMILLGDAARSPYTVAKHQQTFLFQTSYRF